MKWLVIVMVAYLPTYDQWDMVDYRHSLFDSSELCTSFVQQNRHTFIQDANELYQLNEPDFRMFCVSTDDFFNKILVLEAHPT